MKIIHACLLRLTSNPRYQWISPRLLSPKWCVTSVGYMHVPRSIQMNYCIFFSILCFLFTLSIILIHSHEPTLSLYFLLFYFPLFVPLFTTGHSSFASALRLHMCTDILVRANSLATQQAFASTHCNSSGVCFHWT